MFYMEPTGRSSVFLLSILVLVTVSCKLGGVQQSEKVNSIQVSFAGSSVRFEENAIMPEKKEKEWKVTAWRNEKIHTQIALWADTDYDNFSIVASDLTNENGNIISKDQIRISRVGFVMTDEFRSGCGHRKSVDFDSSRVADIIHEPASIFSLARKKIQPVWITVVVPEDAKPGNYTGTVIIETKRKQGLTISLKVIDKTLPAPSQWTYHFDLWQHPAAIARVHHLQLWSEAHFDAMRKYYTMLANAGQKVITASITDEPWGHQTYDDFPSLISWTKKKDGTWKYDYSLFDKYVEFVMSCGIRDRINCYSMIPWKIAFKYFDEGTGKEEVFTEEIGTPGYENFWRTMLVDFTQHLKEKKWFDITAIAMDERPMASMQSVIRLLKSIDPNWKISLAGDFHPEIEAGIDDYCVASRWQFPENILQSRKAAGKISTWYTCCTEPYPNGFTFSPPDEHVWIGYYTAAKHFDGYLRWAYNSWTANPLTDSRFTAWPAGDTYQVYPGPLSSIRFEKMIEGVQGFEKVQYLRNLYTKNGDNARLSELENALKKFDIPSLATQTASDHVRAIEVLVNRED